jgi:hypothetical protein
MAVAALARDEWAGDKPVRRPLTCSSASTTKMSLWCGVRLRSTCSIASTRLSATTPPAAWRHGQRVAAMASQSGVACLLEHDSLPAILEGRRQNHEPPKTRQLTMAPHCSDEAVTQRQIQRGEALAGGRAGWRAHSGATMWSMEASMRMAGAVASMLHPSIHNQSIHQSTIKIESNRNASSASLASGGQLGFFAAPEQGLRY